jgi:hypothetical protein
VAVTVAAGDRVVGGPDASCLIVVLGSWARGRVVAVVAGLARRVVTVVGAVAAGPDEGVVDDGSGAVDGDIVVSGEVPDVVVAGRPAAN